MLKFWKRAFWIAYTDVSNVTIYCDDDDDGEDVDDYPLWKQCEIKYFYVSL